MPTSTLDQIRTLAAGLSAQEKLYLIDDLVQQLLRQPLPSAQEPFRSLRGALADLGPAPSAEEIDGARHEAWANLPREDVSG